jgi:hypothetical protein
MRYASKEALLADIRGAHDSLCERLSEIPTSRYREAGVWGDDWTVNDLVAHLAEWHFLLLGWYDDGLKGATPVLPAPGYTWRETPRLNRAIWAKHRARSMAVVRDDFDAGYRRILDIVEALPANHLIMPGHFAWTGQHPLATYIGPNTASHYRFASRAITRWLRHSAAHRTRGARPAVRRGAARKKVGRRTPPRQPPRPPPLPRED